MTAPGPGVQVTFKHPRTGPYFTCVYPGTTYADYLLYLLAASKGRHEHAHYMRRPYVPVPLDV